MNLGYMGDITSRAGIYGFGVTGGYQKLSARVVSVSDTEIKVRYTLGDHFGAGVEDADRWLIPGLQGMYYLQHNKSAGRSQFGYTYTPFKWTVDIERTSKRETK